MRAYALDEFGKPGTVRELPKPEPGAGEVLVRVEAAGVNPFDSFVVGGYLKDRMEHRFPLIPGGDLAGTIEAVGQNVAELKVGDAVLGGTGKAYLGAGTFAEYATASTGAVALRGGLNPEAAGAAPLAGVSALQAVDAVEPKPGDTVVVIGAAGGIGSFAVQLLAHAGARVIAIARGANRQYLEALGATETVDYEAGDTVAAIRKAAPKGVAAIVAITGDRAMLAPYIELLPHGGRVSSMRGAADVEELAGRGIRGANIGTALASAPLARLVRLLESGTLRAPEIKTFGLEQAGDAIAEVAAGHTRGKLVVIPAR